MPPDSDPTQRHIAPNRHALVGGLVLWLLFCIVAVLLRGIRWEETFEHALIITHRTPYPEGHPMFRYVRNAFSLQSYLSAIWLWFLPSPALLCFLRNTLQLLSATLPVYLIAARLSGRSLWGHAAAALVLLEGHSFFESYYPVAVWPHFFSVGQIGMGYALLVLALLLFGKSRSAWLLLGLMPAVHIGQWPVLLLTALLHAGWSLSRAPVGHVELSKRLLPFGAGLLMVAVFGLIHWRFHVPAPAFGVYAAQEEYHAIWAAYSPMHDLHRFFTRFNPFGHTVILMIASMLLGIAAAREEGLSATYREGHHDTPGPHFWIQMYIVLVCSVVTAVLLLQHVLGSATPFLLIGWMPHRLTNHLAPLLIALAVSALLSPRGRNHSGGLFVTLLLGLAVFSPVLSSLLPANIGVRYLDANEHVLFLLIGGAFGMHAACPDQGTRFVLVWGIGCALAWLCLAWYHQFSAALLACGFSSVWILHRVLPARPVKGFVKERWPGYSLAALVLLLVAGSLVTQWRHRETLPMTPIQRETRDFLASAGETEAMIVTPYWEIEWLARTEHPVLADYQTAHLMTYLPSLAPAIKRLHADVFGIAVDGAAAWNLEAWKDRDTATWRRLGEAYGFAYVVSPQEIPLTLAPLLSTDTHRLYGVR